MQKGRYMVTFCTYNRYLNNIESQLYKTMLIKKLPYILSTLLIALVIGCGTSNPLADEAESTYKDSNYEATLAAAEKSIEQYPGDPRGYFYKAIALGSLAEAEDVQERADYYTRMNKSFETAQAVADTIEDKPDEVNRIDATKQTYFRLEYDRGVKLFQDDSVMQTVENPLEQSIAHFNNATIILPENADGWNALSITNARNQNFAKAAEAKNKFMSLAADTSKKAIDYIQLGSFYRSTDQQEKAVEAFEMGQEQFPGNADLITNLASSYVAIGKPQQAIKVFEQLISANPDNPEYRLTMGSELYNQAFNAQESIKENNQKISALEKEGGKEDQISTLKKENEKLSSRADTYLTRAEEELKTALEHDPENASAYEVLGIIHQFKAQMVFEELGRTPNNQNEKAAALDKQGKQLLNDAMGYYEKAVEIDPENQNYWKKLFQIYAALGMDKKAQEAMEKAGMN